SGLDPQGDAVDARHAHALAAPERSLPLGPHRPRRTAQLALPRPAGLDVVEQQRFLADDRIDRARLAAARPRDQTSAQRHQADERDGGEEEPLKPGWPTDAEPHERRRDQRTETEEEEVETSGREHLAREQPEAEHGPYPPRHARPSLGSDGRHD